MDGKEFTFNPEYIDTLNDLKDKYISGCRITIKLQKKPK